MVPALAVWSRYPKQIEAGLRAEYPGVSIRQWHRGELSSREFLVLVEGMSAESWFKTCLVAALRREKADAEREAMLAAHADVHGRLLGEIRSPYEMTMSVVEKHALPE